MVYFGTYENPSAFVKAYYADKLAGLPSIIREQIDYSHVWETKLCREFVVKDNQYFAK